MNNKNAFLGTFQGKIVTVGFQTQYCHGDNSAVPSDTSDSNVWYPLRVRGIDTYAREQEAKQAIQDHFKGLLHEAVIRQFKGDDFRNMELTLQRPLPEAYRIVRVTTTIEVAAISFFESSIMLRQMKEGFYAAD